MAIFISKAQHQAASWILVVSISLSGCAVNLPTESAGSRFPSYADALASRAPLGTVHGSQSSTPFSVQDVQRYDFSAATEYAQSTQSYALLIWQAGALRYEQYFNGHDAQLRPESASMHKSIMALVFMAALQDQHIGSIQDSVCDYVQEWQGSERCSIKLAHLLSMSSGLAPLSDEGGIASPAAQFFLDGPSARASMLDRPLLHPPGTVFHYSNVDSQILGYVIERATGESYEQYFSRRLWKPLGAADAFVWRNEPDGFPRTYTALHARAVDWLRAGLLIKNDGTANGRSIIDPALIRHMTSPSPTNQQYGWQVWRNDGTDGARFYNDAKVGLNVMQSEPHVFSDLIYFDGFGGQRVYISRASDTVIVRLGDARPDWDDAILPNAVAHALSL